jgi:hypothetical protein
LVAFLLLQACGVTRLRALPDPADQPDQGQHTITRRLPGMTVTIEVEAWRYRPRRLADDYLPFRVVIVNQSRAPVMLQPAEARLLDDHTRVHRPLHPGEVVSLLLEGWGLPALVPSIGFEATGPEPTIFGLELGFHFNRDRDLRDIRRLAFPPEAIPPGGHAEGFIYFPKPPRDARRLTLLLPLDTPSRQHELFFSYAIDH